MVMTKRAIIERTINILNQLPDEKAQEISDFADFIIKRYEEARLTKGIQKLVEHSTTFDFLNEDEDIYSEADLKEVYND